MTVNDFLKNKKVNLNQFIMTESGRVEVKEFLNEFRKTNLLEFEEHIFSDYKSRTLENASADMTIAIAVDFTTTGEKCTENCVRKQGKYFLQIQLKDIINTPVEKFEMINKFFIEHNIKTLNIAGNGIYTLKKHNYSQEDVDNICYNFLKGILKDYKLQLIRSGGQTGIDEAGIKAAIKLNIPSKILAPKGWKLRLISGKDFSNESYFKKRFEIF